MGKANNIQKQNKHSSTYSPSDNTDTNPYRWIKRKDRSRINTAQEINSTLQEIYISRVLDNIPTEHLTTSHKLIYT